MEPVENISPATPGAALEKEGAKEAPKTAPGSGVPPVLDGIAAKIAAQHGAGPAPAPVGTTGKRPGRPPIHGLYSKAAGCTDGKTRVKVPVNNPVPDTRPEPIPPLETPPEPKLSVVIPPDLRSKVVQEGLNVGENIARGKIESLALKCGLTRTEIAPELEKAAIGDRRKALVGELAPLVLEEWGVDPQLSPTTAVALVLGPWVAASTGAIMTLTRLAEEKARRGSPPKASEPTVMPTDANQP